MHSFRTLGSVLRIGHHIESETPIRLRNFRVNDETGSKDGKHFASSHRVQSRQCRVIEPRSNFHQSRRILAEGAG